MYPFESHLCYLRLEVSSYPFADSLADKSQHNVPFSTRKYFKRATGTEGCEPVSDYMGVLQASVSATPEMNVDGRPNETGTQKRGGEVERD